MLMNVGPTKDGRLIPIFEERLWQLGSWLSVNGEAIYRSIPWSHQNNTLTNTIWYVSSISWRTYLEDNYIIFENITASIWDLMIANWVYWWRVKSAIVAVKFSNTIQLFPFKCIHVYRGALSHYWQDDVCGIRQ
jgi:alpha-L-fucosidase